MPSVNFDVVWPDGEKIRYYSPSTIIHQYLQTDTYSLDEFASRCDKALAAASERVYQRFGYTCSAASDEQKKINEKVAALMTAGSAGQVRVALVDASTNT